MESLYLLIPLSIFLALGFCLLLWWAAKSGQFEDLEGPAHRILQDDDTVFRAKLKNNLPPPQDKQKPDKL
jgi:cbb3-type cytochrome oxidase maturation protein